MGGGPPGPQGDFSGAEEVARKHAGSSGDSSLFSTALQHVQQGNATGGINEDDALNAHQQVYNQGGQGGVAANSIGAAAALQALKKMLAGGGAGGAGTVLIPTVSPPGCFMYCSG